MDGEVERVARRIRQAVQGCATHLAGPVLLVDELLREDPQVVVAALGQVADQSDKAIAAIGESEEQAVVARRERMVRQFATVLTAGFQERCG